MIIGFNKNSDIKEIKKQYINLIKKNHPDKGGNNEDFIKLIMLIIILLIKKQINMKV